MQALGLIRRFLIVLGLCIKDDDHPHDGIITNCIIMSLLTGFLMITIDFIVTHSDEVEDFLYAIMQCVTFVTVWTCYICFAQQKRSTFLFFKQFQETVDDYGESC